MKAWEKKELQSELDWNVKHGVCLELSPRFVLQLQREQRRMRHDPLGARIRRHLKRRQFHKWVAQKKQEMEDGKIENKKRLKNMRIKYDLA